MGTSGSRRIPLSVHLGDLVEDYVHAKLAGGGYGSAAEVMREALRRIRALETEAAIERRLEAFVLRGLDQGPPDGVSAEDWDRRLAVVRERMSRLVAEGKLGKKSGHGFYDWSPS